MNLECETPSIRHPVSDEGVLFFIFFAYCKLVHSYTVKHLT